ncbi:MAG: hypothetical protein HPM95_19000 [Alphaproteobacteria bacterium]|nr:hypothetical protein [Alphaproteobacteria bacterium]
MTGSAPTETGLGPELGREWLEMHLRVIAGEEVRYEREMDTARGRVISETTISPIVVAGHIVGGVGVSVDQTLRARAEQRLQSAHKMPARLSRRFSDWVWDTDAAHRVTEVLGDGERLGLDLSGWIGARLWDLADDDLAAGRRMPDPQGADGGAPAHLRRRLRAVPPGRPHPLGRAQRPGDAGRDGAFCGYRAWPATSAPARTCPGAPPLRYRDPGRRQPGDPLRPRRSHRMVNPAFERRTEFSFEEARGRTADELLKCPETDPRPLPRLPKPWRPDGKSAASC